MLLRADAESANAMVTSMKRKQEILLAEKNLFLYERDQARAEAEAQKACLLDTENELQEICSLLEESRTTPHEAVYNLRVGIISPKDAKLSLRAGIIGLKRKLDVLQAEKNAATREKEELRDQIAALQVQMRDREAQAQQLQIQAERAEFLTRDVERLNSELQKQSDLMSDFKKSQASNISRMVRETQMKVGDLESSLHASEQERNSLAQRLDASTARSNNLLVESEVRWKAKVDEVQAAYVTRIEMMENLVAVARAEDSKSLLREKR